MVKFEEISHAYEILSNPDERRKYDSLLHQRNKKLLPETNANDPPYDNNDLSFKTSLQKLIFTSIAIISTGYILITFLYPFVFKEWKSGRDRRIALSKLKSMNKAMTEAEIAEMEVEISRLRVSRISKVDRINSIQDPNFTLGIVNSMSYNQRHIFTTIDSPGSEGTNDYCEIHETLNSFSQHTLVPEAIDSGRGGVHETLTPATRSVTSDHSVRRRLSMPSRPEREREMGPGIETTTKSNVSLSQESLLRMDQDREYEASLHAEWEQAALAESLQVCVRVCSSE